ncbi:MAG: DEAD/DEAH box helicase family protein [Leptospiraceae bacterium]|nr:DEAD/DEAH box helicase family protein [Leptospiraceae bacterium]
MATGTGKTITALYCLLKEFHEEKRFNAVIIVPTLSLLNQWYEEAKKFNFRNFVLVSLESKWEQGLKSFINSASLPNSSFIIIVTYASFKKERLQEYFRKLPPSTLLIADEAHNLGSKDTLRLLPKIAINRRIGLSATPNRKYDEAGNGEIESFFNDNNPYVYSFSMKEAIQKNFLCTYTYHPYLVQLTDEEFEEYLEITKKLARFFNDKEGFKNSPEAEKLLLLRKRIIHKANNKKKAFREIIEIEFKRKGNLKYTLVYAPEGIENNYSDVETEIESQDDIKLLDEYSRIVRDIDKSVMISQFIANTYNRDNVLKEFEQGDRHVLVSMKCLDEGIDVPRSEVAIFCASTGNPRQFIQRRGRVLRPHIDKTYARIYDLVVIPPSAGISTYAMERNLIKNELERVIEFSDLSMNKMETYTKLQKVLNDYNLSFTK